MFALWNCGKCYRIDAFYEMSMEFYHVNMNIFKEIAEQNFYSHAYTILALNTNEPNKTSKGDFIY